MIPFDIPERPQLAPSRPLSGGSLQLDPIRHSGSASTARNLLLTRLLSRVGQVGADAQRRRPGPQNHKRKLSGCMRSSTCSPTYFCQHPAGTSTLSAHLQLHIVLSASCIVPHGHFAHFLPVSLTPNNHGYATMTAHLPHIVPHGLPTSANIVKLHIAPPTSCSLNRNHLFRLSVFNCTPKQGVC